MDGAITAPAANAQRALAPHGVIRRPALFERLSAAGPGAIVLVCAPAGSGKTVLLRSWLEAEALENRVAWVAVEREERDAQRFWLSVIDRLAEADGAVTPISPTPSFRGRSAVERLAAELSALEKPLVLVIDDLHELRSSDALAWLELFLPLLPARLRVVLSTREDPDLGLHRRRLDGRLTEIRGRDLLFSEEESRELLEASGITLPAADVALLHERTEGWAAGLRLASISLADHPEPERFVREFCGSERTVAGYLMAEVLQRQPAEVRELLLRTSVLERVNGPLADFLTGREGSERILHELEDRNAFVTSADTGRTWFRYHHLFADLLQLELRRASPGSLDALNRAAAEWFEEHGQVVEAIRHAQAAGDWPHAARLLADNYVDLVFDGRKATLRALLAAFPPDAPQADAELALAFATGRLYDGLLQESATYIAAAEKLAATVPGVRRRLFDFRLTSARLWLACQRADLEGARDAMSSFEPQASDEPARSDDHRASALMNLGIAELWSLHLDDARRDLEEARSLAGRIGRPYLEIGCLGHLALLAVLTGSPSAGLKHSEGAVAIAEAHGWETHRIVAPAVAAAAATLTWLGRFDEAEGWLDRAARSHGPAEELEAESILRHARGFLRLGQGRPEAALAEFRAAENTQTMPARQHALPVDVRGWVVLTEILAGETEAARRALAATDAAECEVPGMRIAAATLELAEGNPRDAVDVLAPLIEDVPLAVLDGSPQVLNPRWATVHALLLEAAARDQIDDPRGAEVSIERALELAEPDGVILPFLLVPVQGLLERHPRHRTEHAALLANVLDVLAGASPRTQPQTEALPEELSEAELRVVRFLPTNLTAPEIANELVVSPNTVRTHLRHIYAKLDAHSRSEAVARARKLGLLAPSSRLRA